MEAPLKKVLPLLLLPFLFLQDIVIHRILQHLQLKIKLVME